MCFGAGNLTDLSAGDELTSMPLKPFETLAQEEDNSGSETVADTRINYDDAIQYWSSVPASVNGVLGGFGEQTPVPKADIIGSSTFLRKLLSRMPCPEGQQKLTIDMGAGIGRITRDLLWKVSDKCDLLEPLKPFVEQYMTLVCKSGLVTKEKRENIGSYGVSGVSDSFLIKNLLSSGAGAVKH